MPRGRPKKWQKDKKKKKKEEEENTVPSDYVGGGHYKVFLEYVMSELCLEEQLLWAKMRMEEINLLCEGKHIQRDRITNHHGTFGKSRKFNRAEIGQVFRRDGRRQRLTMSNLVVKKKLCIIWIPDQNTGKISFWGQHKMCIS